ncbi:MAG: winged helix-turn-helix domain-containing protein, partial [Acidimicrobiia bacterium]|nr:winged helix-turn-helix domain-containing protein [Acidimicrobiia bacterium]
MRFHVLGPVRVTDRGSQLPLGGRQQRLVLALLLARPGTALSTDRLVEEIWDGVPPGTARKTLQGYIHHLRRVVGDTIRTDNNGYRLDLSSAFFDAREFELAVDETIDGDRPPAEVSDRLADALAMWAGTPYADVDHAIALRPEITRLTELRLSALEGRIEADIALGGGPDLVGELRSVTSDYPLRERFAGQLMRSLYLAGRQTEALRVYDRTREHLVEEVGLEPSPELTTLRDGILQHDPALSVTVQGGRTIHSIKGYELRETVAESGNGRLERAYQTSIGRQVAINVIEAPRANDTAFVAAFSDEASAASRLAHPHLVPISDFWREPGRAYIVSPWFEGGSLVERTLTATAFEQAASALAYAHRQGVIHGNISAADIVFDLDGNAYLGGFVIGQPPSPGHRLGETTAETDVFSAAMAADIAGLTALIPKHAPRDWLANEEIQHVLDRGTTLDSESRYPRVEDLLRDFRRALGRDVTAMAGSRAGDKSDLRNPFKGLRAFQESDEADFFGRKDLIDSVVEALDHHRFVTVIGSSGGGKSSLVKAGVIPALKRKAGEEGSKLLVAEMYPGSYPFEELEAALMGIATSRPERLFEQLIADDRGLLRVAKSILPIDVGQVLLVIDQFEELFSMVSDESTRSLFINSLLAAVDDEQSRISVIVTLRADYFNRPLDYTDLARVVEDGLVPVTPLSAEGLGRAVAGPARAVGLDLEPGLVARIVADLEGQPGGLPLLQYALTEMFEVRDANVLTIDTYNRIGGVAGALAGRAEKLFNGLDAAGQEAVRQSFLRLVTVDADKNDLRRRVR